MYKIRLSSGVERSSERFYIQVIIFFICLCYTEGFASVTASKKSSSASSPAVARSAGSQRIAFSISAMKRRCNSRPSAEVLPASLKNSFVRSASLGCCRSAKVSRCLKRRPWSINSPLGKCSVSERARRLAGGGPIRLMMDARCVVGEEGVYAGAGKRCMSCIRCQAYCM